MHACRRAGHPIHACTQFGRYPRVEMFAHRTGPLQRRACPGGQAINKPRSIKTAATRGNASGSEGYPTAAGAGDRTALGRTLRLVRRWTTRHLPVDVSGQPRARARCGHEW